MTLFRTKATQNSLLISQLWYAIGEDRKVPAKGDLPPPLIPS
jgi:hypothetical protein